MSALSAADLERILGVVEEALRNHTHWHDDLLRQLLCRLPLPKSVIAPDAHHHCAFGTWFYSMGRDQVEQLPSFRRIGELHKHMHDSARAVAQTIQATGFVPEHEYDSFERRLSEFREALYQLRERVAHTVAERDAC